MVTAAKLNTNCDESKRTSGKTRLRVNQPIMCIDGMFFVCQYKGEYVLPLYETNISLLIDAMEIEKKFKDNRENFEILFPSRNEKDDEWQIKLQKRMNFRNRISSDSSAVSNYNNNVITTNQNIIDPALTSIVLPLLSKKQQKHCDRKYETKNENCKYDKLLKSAEEYCIDYINTENIKNSCELQSILEVLCKYRQYAIIFALKIDNQNEITLTYQFLKSFKNNYMIAPVNRDYCMIMKAF